MIKLGLLFILKKSINNINSKVITNINNFFNNIINIINKK